MVSLIGQDAFNKTVTLFGLSTDTKPTTIMDFKGAELTIKNGSVFYEIDTAGLYLFDEENKIWVEQE